MNRVNELPNTYNEASDLLGNADSRNIANNTRLHRLSDNIIGLELHDTTVVEVESALNSLTFSTGGWRSVTTKQRINACLGVRGSVYSEKRVWFYRSAVTGQTIEFEEGLMVDADGNPIRTNAGMVPCVSHAQ